MLARVLSAAVNGIEAFPVEVEVNCGWGDTTVVMLSCNLPMPSSSAAVEEAKAALDRRATAAKIKP